MIREQLSTIDSVSLKLSGDTGVTISIILALIMYGIALNIKAEDFKNIFIHPKSVITGLVLQWVGLPFVTFLLVFLLGKWITPMVALGMILVAACPGGNISNFMSSFSKANIELSVSMAAISTIFAPIITPLNFWLWGNLYLKFADLSAVLNIPKLTIPFGEMFIQVATILGVPILLGILTAKYLPKMATAVKKPFSIFSIIIFFGMVAAMFVPNWEIIIHYVIFVFIIVLIHNASAFATGWLGASAMKLPVRDRRSLTIEVGIQNSGLGLALLLNPAIFKPDVWNNPETGIMYGGMMFVVAWWGIWHIISGLTLSTLFRHHPLPENEQ